jgi:hypothetical protein
VDGWDEADTEPAPVPALPGGEEDEEDDGETPALPPPEARMRRLLSGGQKSIGLGAFPGLLDAVQALAAPALERDLTAYFKGQSERVQKRLARG